MSKIENWAKFLAWFGVTLMYFVTYNSAENIADAGNYIESIYREVKFIAIAAFVITLNKIFYK